jgi:hypothetical protein
VTIPDESLEERALRLLELDPATHVVVGTPKFKRWQLHHGDWRESVQVSVAERDQDVDLDDLVRQLRRRNVRPQPASSDGDAFVLALADWQIGKSDGDGVRGTVARVRAAIDEAEARIKLLRRHRSLDTLVIAGMGDIIEGCAGHYPAQQHTVALDRRQQCALARELVTQAVAHLAPLFPESVVIAAVPGNHGENRQGGKAITGISDNDDIAVFEQVYEAVQMSERFPQVRFVEPEPGEAHVTLAGDEWGPGLCLFHGHVAGAKDMQKWWAGQSQGRMAPGNADVLVTAHYHHFKMSEESGRVWLQAPSPESISQWWANRTGQTSPPGTLSFVLTDHGVDDVKVLGREAPEQQEAA